MDVDVSMECGCTFTVSCCICLGQSPECFPYHFARGRWRVYPGPEHAQQGQACRVRAHRHFFAHGGDRYTCPQPDCGRKLVLMAKPSQEERTMLYALARRMKPKDKKRLRESIREGKAFYELLSQNGDDPIRPEWPDYMRTVGRPDMNERERAWKERG